MTTYSYEKLGGGIEICVSPAHTFGTDAFLLSYFAQPKRKDRVCDLGTGCGIIPLLWQRSPITTPKETFALDLQPQAIEQLRETQKRSSLVNFTAMEGDLRQIKELFPAGSMDVVTCNPPYNVPGTGYMSQSSSDQIARHETACNFDDICTAATWLLRWGGRFCICQLPERLTDMIVTLRNHNLEPKRIRFVQHWSDAAPWLVLIEGRHGGKSSMKVEHPLVMKNSNGPTEEMETIYGLYGKVES